MSKEGKATQILDRSQSNLWHVQRELKSLATLFLGVQTDDINGEDLYGIGLILNRMSTKIENVTGQLEKVTVSQCHKDEC